MIPMEVFVSSAAAHSMTRSTLYLSFAAQVGEVSKRRLSCPASEGKTGGRRRLTTSQSAASKRTRCESPFGRSFCNMHRIAQCCGFGSARKAPSCNYAELRLFSHAWLLLAQERELLKMSQEAQKAIRQSKQARAHRQLDP